MTEREMGEILTELKFIKQQIFEIRTEGIGDLRKRVAQLEKWRNWLTGVSALAGVIVTYLSQHNWHF